MESKKSKASEKPSESPAAGLKDTIKGYVQEVENTSESLASEVKQHFDDLTERVSSLVSGAAETTVSMAEKVTIKDPAQLIKGLLEEIKQVSEVSLKVISDRFDELRHRALSSTDETDTVRKTAKKKPATRKKVAAKKAGAKKKVAARKKVVTKKKVVRKAAGKKKAAARKTTASKKKTAARKTTASGKKTVARKKTAAKKKVTARKTTASRKKPAAAKKAAVRRKAPARR